MWTFHFNSLLSGLDRKFAELTEFLHLAIYNIQYFIIIIIINEMNRIIFRNECGKRKINASVYIVLSSTNYIDGFHVFWVIHSKWFAVGIRNKNNLNGNKLTYININGNLRLYTPYTHVHTLWKLQTTVKWHHFHTEKLFSTWSHKHLFSINSKTKFNVTIVINFDYYRGFSLPIEPCELWIEKQIQIERVKMSCSLR